MMQEKHTKRQLKVLWSDGDGEYTSREFEPFCEDMRIQHEIETPYTPQYNGLSKTRNKTIVNTTKSC